MKGWGDRGSRALGTRHLPVGAREGSGLAARACGGVGRLLRGVSVCMELSYVRDGGGRPEEPQGFEEVLEASPLAEKLPSDGKPSQEEGAGQEAANPVPGVADRAGRGRRRGRALTFRPAS